MPSQGRHGPRRARRARERDRQRAVRAQGFRSASILTRVAIAASIALSGVFSAVAAIAFPGRSSRDTASGEGATSRAQHPPQTVALPPANAGGVPVPPAQVPVPAAGSGQVSSGGS